MCSFTELKISLNAIGCVLGVQRIASSARSVRVVWHDYKALVSHLEIASNDRGRDSKEKTA
jgi:hypothetical protein